MILYTRGSAAEPSLAKVADRGPRRGCVKGVEDAGRLGAPFTAALRYTLQLPHLLMPSHPLQVSFAGGEGGSRGGAEHSVQPPQPAHLHFVSIGCVR